MYFDSHTHLNELSLFENYKTYVENFKKIWWKKLVNVWVDFDRTERAFEIEKNYPDVCYATWWFHPTEPIFKFKNWEYEFKKGKLVSWNEYLKLAKNYLEEIIQENKIIAIWECWLDYHYFECLKDGQTEKEVKKQQEQLLVLQLDLARKYNLPVVIHSRDAFLDSIKILENYKDLKIYFHCWGYGSNEIEQVKNIFPKLWVGFDGNITYKKAQELRDSIKKCDLNSILL